ncbi:MAG: hypothetical protein WCY19_02885 [Candidatus Gastranaerophilaceae bacterium]
MNIKGVDNNRSFTSIYTKVGNNWTNLTPESSAVSKISFREMRRIYSEAKNRVALILRADEAKATFSGDEYWCEVPREPIILIDETAMAYNSIKKPKEIIKFFNDLLSGKLHFKDLRVEDANDIDSLIVMG